jgi:hypothetical protein
MKPIHKAYLYKIYNGKTKTCKAQTWKRIISSFKSNPEPALETNIIPNETASKACRDFSGSGLPEPGL